MKNIISLRIGRDVTTALSLRISGNLYGSFVYAIKTLLIAAVVAVSSIGSASASVIVNGDFSANASSFVAWPGYVGIDGNPAITGWSSNVAFGSYGPGLNGINALGNYPSPNSPIVAFGPSAQQTSPDCNWAFLQGAGTALYQYITVTPGVTYTANFKAAGRSGLASPGSCYVVESGQPGGGVIGGNATGTLYSDVNFVTGSFTFTPVAQTSVQFVIQNSGGGDAVNFTNISVIPEPSTYAMLLGGLGAMTALRRRRR